MGSVGTKEVNYMAVHGSIQTHTRSSYMGKGYSCSYLVLSPCNCNYFIQLQHSRLDKDVFKIRKLYQIKTIDTTVHTVESPCMLYM